MSKSHRLDRLLAYWSGYSGDRDLESYKYGIKEEEDGSFSIKLELGNRTFIHEGCNSKKTAKDEVLRAIINTGVDMLLDDELWELYRKKLNDKFKKK